MKKYILIATVLLIFSFSAFGQGLSFDIKSGVLIPLSKFNDTLNTGYGGTLRIGYMVSNDITITGKSGYFYFPGETITIENGTRKMSFGIIPILFGVKYFPPFLNQLFSDEKMRFYCSAEVGVFSIRYETNLNNGKSVTAVATENWPGFSPSFGLQYKMFNNFYIGYDFDYHFIATAKSPITWMSSNVNFQYDLKF